MTLSFKNGGSGSGITKRHGHTAGEHRRHLGGMANDMASAVIYDSEVWDCNVVKCNRWEGFWILLVGGMKKAWLPLKKGWEV